MAKAQSTQCQGLRELVGEKGTKGQKKIGNKMYH